jgi:uncharacterized RDD family membrane protein YckC
VLRTVNAQPTLWEALLPEVCLGLPAELAGVDRLLDDPVFFEPYRAHFHDRLGRPSVPIETYLRLMFLKYRYRMGFDQSAFVVAAALFASLGAIAKPGAEKNVSATTMGLLVTGWVIAVLYEVWAARAGSSVGKFTFRLRIVDQSGRGRVSLGRAVLRWLALSSLQPLIWLWLVRGSRDDAENQLIYLLFSASLVWRGVVGLSTVFDRAGRGVHEKLAGTAVVRA